MNRVWKRGAALALSLVLLLGLAACKSAEDQITTLVKGNIDEIYLGQFNEDYLELVDSSEAQAEEAYLDGLAVEAEFFANYFAIVDEEAGITYDDVDEDLKQEIIDLYKEIYSHSKYEVQKAVKSTSTSYTVTVLVEPIDIMHLAYDAYDTYGPIEELNARYPDQMTDEEYFDYSMEYGHVMVQLVRDQLPNLGYLEQKSQAIQVAENSDGYLSINEDDWDIFDTYVIDYP